MYALSVGARVLPARPAGSESISSWAGEGRRAVLAGSQPYTASGRTIRTPVSGRSIT